MMMRSANFKLTLLLLILCYAAILYADSFLKTTATPLGAVSYEFIGSVASSDAALKLWGEQGRIAATFSLGIDFLFLLLYSVVAIHLLSGSAAKIAKYSYKLSLAIKSFIPVFVFAAICDVLENLCLFQLLLGSRNELFAQSAYFLASTKFVIIVVCLLVYIGSYLYIRLKQNYSME